MARKLEVGIAGVGCFILMAWATFWGLVVWVAWHFISKFW